MKLEKAIAILESEIPNAMPNNPPKHLDANKLGIEALKGWIEGRCKPGGMFFHDLPGETED